MSNANPDAKELSPLRRAYLALERMDARCRALEQARAEPIAVVGMACRLPGGAADPESYWRLLREGVDAVTDAPAGRWDVDAFYDPDPAAPGKMCTKRAGFLREPIDEFDPACFGISPREAETMDPQQRLLLEVAFEALENAAQVEDRLAGSATGVFIGMTSHDFADYHLADQDYRKLGAHIITGNTGNAAAGRLSYCFGFLGPCMAVDTACSSSLVAIHLACQSLHNKECRRALAGGVNLMLSPVPTIALSQGRVLAPDGVCRAFDAAASGMVRGEGCAVIVLKRLSDAQADGDNILAVIRNTAVNQDGPSSGLTVPNGPAQEALIREALRGVDLRPEDIDYMEAHGTGTPLGDPIELRALANVFGGGRDRPLVVGSVKTNIGHLEASAGVASLMKVVLSLGHREIPAHLHFSRPTPHLPWDELPLVVPAEAWPWPVGARPRRAGVSSFGFSGVNAHIVLEEAPVPPPQAGQGAVVDRPLHLLALAGRSEALLRQTAARFAEHFRQHPGLNLADAAYSAGVGRAVAGHRLAVVASTLEEARDRLGAAAAGRTSPGVVRGEAETPPKVAFLFTGQGSQYVGMGRELYDTQPAFRRTLDRCDEILRSHLPRPLLAAMFGQPGTAALDDTIYAQPVLFALGYALAELWRSWGVRPAVALGHSLGEYVAACVAGVFSLEDGLALVAERARLMQSLPKDGSMCAVFADATTVEAAIQPYAAEVAVAAYNAPENVVVSGRAAAIEALATQFAARGVKTQPLRVSHAFHSPSLDPILDAFEAKVRAIPMAAPKIGVISNLDGGLAAADFTTPGYWRRHLRQPVRFAAGVETARAKGCTVFLELGPKPTLLGLAQQSAPDDSLAWLASLRPGQSDWQTLLDSLATLYTRGTRLDWAGFERDYPRRRVALPTTPFQRRRCWPEPPAASHARRHAARGGHPLLGGRLDVAGMPGLCFESRLDRDDPAYLRDHAVFGEVILPAAGYLEMAVAAGAAALGTDGVALENVAFERALILPETGARTVQTLLQPDGADAYSFTIHSRGDDPAAEPWVRHASGRIIRDGGSGFSPTPLADLAQGRTEVRPTDRVADAGAAVDVAGLYEQCRARGIDFGPRFHALRRAWRRDDTALAELALPEALGAGAVAYHLHPVLLDAAFQAMGAVFAGRDGGADDEVYLPVAVDRLRLHRRGGICGWSRVRVEPVRGAADQSLKVDLTLFTPEGALVASLEGLHLKRADREQLRAAAGQDFADWLYEVEWRAANPEPSAPVASAQVGRHWLILAPEHSALADALRRRLQASGDTAWLVQPGDSFQRAADYLRVDPRNPADFRRLLAECAGLSLAGIVHLWSFGHPHPNPLPEGEGAGCAAEALATASHLGGESALHLVQALMERPALPPPLWLVTRGAQPVSKAPDARGIAGAALWGFGRTVNLECPELPCVCVDLGGGGDAALEAGLLSDEICRASAETQVAFRDGQRFVPRLTRHAMRRGTLPIRADGSYLVTGGCRGLGLETAKWLVERGARCVALLGRGGTNADPDAVAALAELRQAGARVETYAADVTDADQLATVFARLDAELPPLRGIVHAAGVIEDGILAQQTADQFRRVLAPKLSGAWHLHTLSLGRALDFFVMYSSLASLFGSPGQSNYSAANACLDALAHYRRGLGLPALSVNWGAWSEAGAAVRHGVVQRARAAGLGAITTRQGVRVLEYLLGQDAAQVAVAPIDWPVFARQAESGKQPPFFADFATAPPAGKTGSTDRSTDIRAELRATPAPEREARLAAYLRAQVAAVLRLVPEDLSLEQPLNRLGLDSLMAVELRGRLRSQLGLDVPLVRFMEDVGIRVLAAELNPRLAAPAPDSSPPKVSEPGPAYSSGPLDGAPLLAQLDRLDQLSDDEVDALLSAALADGPARLLDEARP